MAALENAGLFVLMDVLIHALVNVVVHARQIVLLDALIPVIVIVVAHARENVLEHAVEMLVAQVVVAPAAELLVPLDVLELAQVIPVGQVAQELVQGLVKRVATLLVPRRVLMTVPIPVRTPARICAKAATDVRTNAKVVAVRNVQVAMDHAKADVKGVWRIASQIASQAVASIVAVLAILTARTPALVRYPSQPTSELEGNHAGISHG